MENNKIEEVLTFAVKEWCNNCGLSSGKRTFYYDLAMHACEKRNEDFYHNSTIFFNLVKEKSPGCEKYDIIEMNKESYSNILELEKENLLKNNLLEDFNLLVEDFLKDL